MLRSRETTPDALLKKLRIELAVATKGTGALFQCGANQFFDGDHRPTSDSLDLAVQAFFYLCFDDEDCWRDNLLLVEGVLSFLSARFVGSYPTPQQCKSLTTLVHDYPASKEAIEAWFLEVYPPLDQH